MSGDHYEDIDSSSGRMEEGQSKKLASNRTQIFSYRLPKSPHLQLGVSEPRASEDESSKKTVQDEEGCKSFSNPILSISHIGVKTHIFIHKY